MVWGQIKRLATTGSSSVFPVFSFASIACLFSNLCINILRFPRLLQLSKKFPTIFAPAFPATVPRADAATCPANEFKSTLKNLELTSSSSTCSPVFGLTSPPSTGFCLLSPNSTTSSDNMMGMKTTNSNVKHFIVLLLV